MTNDEMTEDEYPELADWPSAPKTYEAIEAIVNDHACKMIDGVLVDAWTASAIVTVYKACNEQQRIILMSLPIARMGHTAWKIVGKGKGK
jgi:hypothetical protein